MRRCSAQGPVGTRPGQHSLTSPPRPACPQAVNGILIPGGSQDLRPGAPFFDTVSHLFDLAIAANKKGNYFPVRGQLGLGVGEAHVHN